MIIVLAGLAVSIVGGMISTVDSNHKALTKVALIVLTLVGGVVAYVSADNEKNAAQAKEAQAKQELARLTGTLDLVRYTVGDLAKLNELSGGKTYYVRIAADVARGRLAKYLDRIEGQFKGARSSGLVTIREPKPGSSNYELVFGQHLDVASAEVFHRLAMSHRFPPESNVAAIVAE